MNFHGIQKAVEYIRKLSRQRKRRYNAVLLMAAAVAAGTRYMLAFPAQTLETAVGEQEQIIHIHSESCYSDGETLICGIPRTENKGGENDTEHILTDANSDEELSGDLPPDENEAVETEPEADGGSQETADSETEENTPDTEDFLYIKGLKAGEPNITEAKPGDVVKYPFTFYVDCYTQKRFDGGRVKYEILLPAAENQAEFALSDMEWLDDSSGYEPVITHETRAIDGEEKECRVLNCYMYIEPENAKTFPAVFTKDIAVRVNDERHNCHIAVTINAAMEHNTWDGLCLLHECEEKVTAVSAGVLLNNPDTADKEKSYYEQYSKEIEELEKADLSEDERLARINRLSQRLKQAYLDGVLTLEHFNEMYCRVHGEESLSAVAEATVGSLWIFERDRWLEKYKGKTFEAEQTVSAPPAKKIGAASAYSIAKRASAPVSEGESSSQIKSTGGTRASDDGVSVSKTIAGTDIENIFDITLQIKTSEQVTEVYNEPDMAVVVVMDISNTMTSNVTNDDGTVTDTRYSAAVKAAKQFMAQFANYAGDVSKIGFVAFNTDAHEIFPLQTCNTPEKLTYLQEKMEYETGSIIWNYEKNSRGDCIDLKRFTNIEGGLKMGFDMLNAADVKNQNKYIIFLSDGFPTTYLVRNQPAGQYVGYNTNTSSGTKGADGVFYDALNGYYCYLGTSYSDKAAIYARQMAENLKNQGVKIFSIGVDIGAQTISGYEKTGFSIIDRGESVRVNGYELGSENDKDAFKNWLKNKIGSGYYYDSHHLGDLTAGFADIFEKIRQFNAESAYLDWVASDPMPEKQEGVGHDVEFIGFYTRSGRLVDTDLAGESKEITDIPVENTAVFDSNSKKIIWDVKKSGYYAMGDEDNKTYLMSLKYRVRLKNEDGDFTEYHIYNTNDTTTLDYRVIEIVGDNKYISGKKTIEFPIPSVEGYLGELSFTKKDNFGKAVKGAEFTLSHDTKNCSVCRGDGTCVDIGDFTAVSDENGAVKFTLVPSGHIYEMTETVVPDGYRDPGYTYKITIAYDEVTVEVTDGDGNSAEWDNTVLNMTYYELPSTGAGGINRYILGGFVLITGAASMIYILNLKRKCL